MGAEVTLRATGCLIGRQHVVENNPTGITQTKLLVGLVFNSLFTVSPFHLALCFQPPAKTDARVDGVYIKEKEKSQYAT